MAKRRMVKATTGAGATYNGGAVIVGVPARNLTADEFARFGELIAEQQELTGLVLYEPVTVSTADNEEVTP